ncbi:hypothetical protein FE782_13130 [Paenibacillus antri]|uniref:DUF2264 domain-containing protein n=1 Tax=Paenibacillus antri TaxID=2582848 RepID=A0A5R9GBZ4_9BACL|nr:hypothetical protein [Paenibacillus antri]TLS51846.1 hypothetical protein FE782_13130 [Paenibacillus antri]
MSTAQERRRRIIDLIARQAYDRSLLDSGLWFHDDIRNNFYFASYLFAASVDETAEIGFDRQEAMRKAESVLMNALSLQDKDSNRATYGHWPLGLHPDPKAAKPNVLPAELMGILAVWFYRKYSSRMSEGLKAAFEDASLHLYRSGYYRVPLRRYHHHEAKYTAAKLIYGTHFQDEALLQEGKESLRLTLKRLSEQGMPEYGALPWFWHWVQAFTCALECATEEALIEPLRRILDGLWDIRASYYLPGAWVGAHSRGLAHDLPRDGNVGFDYVQFGDFPLPPSLPRVEYAGLLYYEAPEYVVRKAVQRAEPREVRRAVYPIEPQGAEVLHNYAYITERYAVGGMWERVKEFDNEQHRWEATLPLTDGPSVNRLYFFRPGEGYQPGDPRHQHDSGGMLFHRSAVVAYYAGEAEIEQRNVLHGVLPKGQWIQRPTALYGYAQGVYFAVFLSSSGYRLTEASDRYEVTHWGLPAGVVVEALDDREANRMGISDLDAFGSILEERAPLWNPLPDGLCGIEYRSLSGDLLSLKTDGRTSNLPALNGSPIDFRAYHL